MNKYLKRIVAVIQVMVLSISLLFGTFAFNITNVMADAIYTQNETCYYIHLNDTVTFKPTLLNENGKKIAFDTNKYSYTWWRWNDGVGEYLGDSYSYTIKNVSSADCYKLNENEVYYQCEVSGPGIVDGGYAFFKIYENKDINDNSTYEDHIITIDGYDNSNNYYVLLKDTLTLKPPTVYYEKSGEKVKLNNGDFSFSWYKCYDNTSKREYLGNSYTYTIEEVSLSDCYDENNRVHYECDIYNKKINCKTTYFCYLNYSPTSAISFKEYDDDIYTVPGKNITLKCPSVVNQSGNEVDIDKLNITIEWYKKRHKYNNAKEQYLGTGTTYKIKNVGKKDFYHNGFLEEIDIKGEETEEDICNSGYSYICKLKYDGQYIGEEEFYLHNKNNIYTIVDGGKKSDFAIFDIPVKKGKKVSLRVDTLQDYYGKKIKLSNKGFRVEWYKTRTPESGTYDKLGKKISSKKTFTIKNTKEADFFYNHVLISPVYMCKIYEDDVWIGLAEFDLINTDVKKPKIISATKKKSAKTAKIKLKYNNKVSGYQIKISTTKKFTKKKTITNKCTYSSRSVTIKGLKANKTYYVKARSYYRKWSGKKTYYSKWTKIQKIKMK